MIFKRGYVGKLVEEQYPAILVHIDAPAIPEAMGLSNLQKKQ